MGFLNEEISSSSDSFQIHNIVQCCCVDKCCSKVLIENEKFPCSLCDSDHIFENEKCTTSPYEETKTICQKNEIFGAFSLISTGVIFFSFFGG